MFFFFFFFSFFFFNATATTEIYTLSLPTLFRSELAIDRQDFYSARAAADAALVELKRVLNLPQDKALAVDDGGIPGLVDLLADARFQKFFDSLAMEECGNICVATIGECGISVISPEGELVEFVATPDIFTTNICFGGEDMMDAYICLSASGKLVKTRWKRPGLKLEYLNK